MKRLAFLLLVPALAFGQLSKPNIYFVTAGDSAASWFVTTTDMLAHTDTMFTSSDTLLGYWVTRSTLNTLLASKQAAGTYLVPGDTSTLVVRFAAKLDKADTASLSSRINAKLSLADTASLSSRIDGKQAAGAYLTSSDSADMASRTYVSAYAQPLGAYLAASDSAGMASRSYVAAYAQPIGSYLSAADTSDGRTYSNSLYGVYLSGAGEPSSGTGKNGDTYFDTSGLYWWKKIAGTWRQQP